MEMPPLLNTVKHLETFAKVGLTFIKLT
uniref:Uncharacterized protein n=1 Tax=Anguilla anguilla TaxID=7936 RepID=A0A0E9THQ6_ANGAN